MASEEKSRTKMSIVSSISIDTLVSGLRVSVDFRLPGGASGARGPMGVQVIA